MASDSYTVFYYPVWGVADHTRLILDYIGANYTNEFVQFGSFSKELKDQQRFGKIPRLTIKDAKGATKHLWESRAIEGYLVEVFDLIPAGADAYKRAESFGIVSSWQEACDKVFSVIALEGFENRKAAYQKVRDETIPEILKCHEKLLATGPFYYGNKATHADLVLFGSFLRMRDIFGDENPINETSTPNIMRAVKVLDAGRAGEYDRHRRTFGGSARFSKEEYKFTMS